MKRPIIIIFLAALAGLFIWLLASRAELNRSPQTHVNAKNIIPTVHGSGKETAVQSEETASIDESRVQPMILLDQDESFVQGITADLNRDGTPDQICAVKKISEQNVYLVPAVQNPATGQYSRLTPIRTGIMQTRTLLFYSMDIIGDRSSAIICSGMTAENAQSLAVYIPVLEKDGKLSFTAVADLRADGSISIQEVPRSDAYNLGLTTGESYPIYAYNSDPDAPQTLNQIERVYRWDRTLRRYEQVSESRIEGKKIESRLMGQLQGGNISSFDDFLTGLWYMPSSAGTTGSKYLYFDGENKEIIFNNGSTEEVFVREGGSARRYGAYLTTRNRSISSIRRLMDIELTGIDEIRVKIQEDVKLKIGVASDWDGVYRKMSGTTTMPKAGGEQTIDDIRRILDSRGSAWVSPDGQILRIADSSYELSGTAKGDAGTFATITVAGKPVFQMRSSGTEAKSRFYRVSAEDASAAGPQRLSLTEVTVSIDSIQLAGSPPIVFERK